VVAAHLPALVDSGAVEVTPDALIMPNYIEAQEATSSDKQRQSESRARRRDRAMVGPPVTERDRSSRGVTPCHDESHRVTPSLAVPSQAKPSQEFSPSELVPPTGKAGAALGASSQASKAVSVAKRKPSKRKPSADAIRIAQHLYQAISAHSPDMLRLLGWTVEIDRGLKAKDITVEDAILIVDYAHHIDDPAGSNGFSWHTNLLSGVAMRKQWKKKALLGKARRYAAAAARNKRLGLGI